MTTQIPEIAFLGICERYNQIREGSPVFWKHNILGLKFSVLSHIFPLSLVGTTLLFSVHIKHMFKGSKIVFLDSHGEDAFYMFFGSAEDKILDTYIPKDQQTYLFNDETPVTNLVAGRIDNPSIVVNEPGQYKVVFQHDDINYPIGAINYVYVPAPPLTEEYIAAVRSNPLANKFARFVCSCKICGDEIKVYTALGRDDNSEELGFVWYRDIPDIFICNCGKTQTNLALLKESFHGILGSITGGSGSLEITQLYEKSVIQNICSQFSELLEKDPREEIMQVFFEENPILLHHFFAKQLFFKSSILGKYKTDFTILSHNGELLLIEIEKPSLRLLTKEGAISADLQHALNQVTDWLFTFEKHRLAVLDTLDIHSDEVTKVRGIVIAGRNEGYQPQHLMKLKWTNLGDVTLFTYDDIVNDMVSLLQKIIGL